MARSRSPTGQRPGRRRRASRTRSINPMGSKTSSQLCRALPHMRHCTHLKAKRLEDRCSRTSLLSPLIWSARSNTTRIAALSSPSASWRATTTYSKLIGKVWTLTAAVSKTKMRSVRPETMAALPCSICPRSRRRVNSWSSQQPRNVLTAAAARNISTSRRSRTTRESFRITL